MIPHWLNEPDAAAGTAQLSQRDTTKARKEGNLKRKGWLVDGIERRQEKAMKFKRKESGNRRGRENEMPLATPC